MGLGATIIGYNWKLSPSPSMTPVVLMDSASGTITQDTVSGLVPGAYFWQVQATNSAGQQGAWSQTQSFTVAGAGPGTPGAPVLAPTRGYSTFHPFESIFFSWSDVPDAVTYRLEVSNDPNFPLGPAPAGVVTFWNDNIRTTSDGFVSHPSLGEGTFFARVFATDSDFAGGIRSLPSNVIQYTVFYNNPIGPPPVLLSPINGATLTLPVTLNWVHVSNPQPSGYVLEVAKDSTFSTIEFFYNQYTDPSATMLSLTPGPKFWRVLSQHGLSSPETLNSPGTNANTDWSAVGTFAISSAPATPVSIAPLGNPELFMYSGASGMVALQLSAVVPAGGATVALSSSHPSLAPVPPTITMPGNIAWAQFPMTVGQVSLPTPVTLTATLNGVSASTQFTLRPPTLNDDPFQAGSGMGFFNIVTAPVTAPTIATISVSGGGVTLSHPLTVYPTLPALTAMTVSPTSVVGGASSTGAVTLSAAAPAGGVAVNLGSNLPLAASVPASVTVPGGATSASFTVRTFPHDTTTVQLSAALDNLFQFASITVNPPSPPGPTLSAISVNPTRVVDQTVTPSQVTIGGFASVRHWRRVRGINSAGTAGPWSTALRFTPQAAPSLSAIALSPTSVVGGAGAQGTATLTTAAPTGGAVVTLSSSNTAVATMPASVTVAAGSTSATFTITTTAVTASTVATITANVQ